jgi:Icc protein
MAALHGRRVQRLDHRAAATEKRRIGRPIMACRHHPPLPVGGAWLDGIGLRNADEFRVVLARHRSVRLWLGGHVQQKFARPHGRALAVTTPATCAQFTPLTDGCVMDLTPPGCRWLELQPDGAVRTQVQ